MKNVIAHHCHVLADGTVIPDPGYEGPHTQQGPFRGSVSFSWLPERGTEPHMIVAERTRRASAAEDALVGVVYRDMVYFWLEAERINGAFNVGSFFPPSVGGLYPSVINLSDYPGTTDPSTTLTDGSYGWTVPDPTLTPYFLTNGASIWVEGLDTIVDSPGEPGFATLPGREVRAVGDMRTLSQTIGADNYQWDVYDVTVREYRYETYTWAQWWAIA